ncbi:MAG: hypothetical protein M3P39_00970, partial [Actinomycetota bacterium]|nr:hypothetical protein [Actinomycetota bacterium]
PAVDFPRPRGRTLVELTRGVPQGALLAPSVSGLAPGENRVGFALFDPERNQVDVDAVALYTAAPDGSRVRGPYVARRESVAPDPPFRSREAQADLEQGGTFYVARVPVRRAAARVVVALASVGGQTVRTDRVKLPPARGGPPDVGDPAIAVHTSTEADVGGDLAQLSTRTPPAREMHQADLADVLGREPVVLLFATPALCQTRVCGPVVDVAEQVRTQRAEDVTFIHQEIYEDDDPAKGVREPVLRWGLRSEPWTFVIDRSGRIAERFEGAFSAHELTRALERVR